MDERSETTGTPERPEQPEVVEVEAEPLPDPDDAGAGLEREVARRVFDTFGPILAAMVIDGVDFVTFGPFALVAGMPVGALAGWLLAGWLGYGLKSRFAVAVAAGAYCAIPVTSPIPVATLIAVGAGLFGRGER